MTCSIYLKINKLTSVLGILIDVIRKDGMSTFAWQISRFLIYLFFFWAGLACGLTYVYGTPEKHYIPVAIVILMIAVTLLLFNWFSFKKIGFFVAKPVSRDTNQ